MNAVRQILWKLLVVGMIPFILGAGFPQMECRCATAKGQRWCECCFRKPSEAQPSNSSLKACCQRRLAQSNVSKSVVAQGSTSDCPTCQQFRNPKTGSCCSLKQVDAPTLSELVDAPNVDVAMLWLAPIVADSQSVLATTNACHDVLSRECLIPPLDRVIVFEHLLI